MDAALLSRAYENILDNALRFTPEDGTVTVSAAVGDGGDLAVRIADSGPGIAAEDLPHLFDPFYRGTGTSSGFGLGLSIARSINRRARLQPRRGQPEIARNDVRDQGPPRG